MAAVGPVGPLVAAEVRDWPCLHAVHEKVKQAVGDLVCARAANHHDMDGHGAKAEQLLREAEGESRRAVALSRAAR